MLVSVHCPLWPQGGTTGITSVIRHPTDMSDPPSVPAGWYNDPTLPETQRYRGGSSWSEHRRAIFAQPLQPTPAASNGFSNAGLTCSLVALVFNPLLLLSALGFTFGCIGLSRSARTLDADGLEIGRGAGIWAMWLGVITTILTVMAFVLWSANFAELLSSF
jgi:hypothetical protein